jgi:3-phenylpropionate/trans-cinnamate dioxygenase ferredoxin subunit
MPQSVRIAAAADVPPGTMRAFRHGEQHVAVYNVGGTLYATDNICSHEYAELADGWLDTDDCTVECPLHGSRFDLRTGQPLGLPAFRPIAVFPVQVEGDDLLVELP